MNESEKQFSLTRAASNNRGGKRQFLISYWLMSVHTLPCSTRLSKTMPAWFGQVGILTVTGSLSFRLEHGHYGSVLHSCRSIFCSAVKACLAAACAAVKACLAAACAAVGFPAMKASLAAACAAVKASLSAACATVKASLSAACATVKACRAAF